MIELKHLSFISLLKDCMKAELPENPIESGFQQYENDRLVSLLVENAERGVSIETNILVSRDIGISDTALQNAIKEHKLIQERARRSTN